MINREILPLRLSSRPKPKGLFVLGADDFGLIYGPDEQAAICRLVDIYAPAQTPADVCANPDVLADADVLFSGWGMCRFDQTLVDAAKNLKVIFYAAGGAGHIATPEAVSRGITVTTAQIANAKPVAEYAVSTILFSLKQGWQLARATRETRTFPDRNAAPGCFGSTVGLISLGMIGRKVVELLRHFDVNVLAYDPFVSQAKATELGVELVSLADIFRLSDVVSLHAPHTNATDRMIGKALFASMKDGATFINTARGGVVDEAEMLDVLRRRPDLHAVLDVTTQEPPPVDSTLYELPNVTLTPHIAGSVGPECRRMSRLMIEELGRYLNGEPLKWQITPVIASADEWRASSDRLIGAAS